MEMFFLMDNVEMWQSGKWENLKSFKKGGKWKIRKNENLEKQ